MAERTLEPWTAKFNYVVDSSGRAIARCHCPTVPLCRMMRLGPTLDSSPLHRRWRRSWMRSMMVWKGNKPFVHFMKKSGEMNWLKWNDRRRPTVDEPVLAY